MTASARPARTPDTPTVPDSAPDTNDRERASTMPTPHHRPARINPDTRHALVAAMSATGLLVAVSFVLSFAGLSALAPWAAVPWFLASLVPLFIDGAILVYTYSALAARARGESAVRPWTWVALWTAVSSLANAAHAFGMGPGGWQGTVGAILAGLFPIGSLLGCHEIADRMIERPDTPDTTATPDTGRPARTDWASIVEELGTPARRRPRTVRRHRVAGQPRPSRATDHADTILRLKADGQSVRSIATAVGLSKTTVSDFLRTQEVPA